MDYLLKTSRGMSFKLFIIAIGISSIVVLLSSILFLTSEKQQLISYAEINATRLSEVIEASLEHAIHDGNWEMVDKIIENESAYDQTQRLWVLDATGTVISSTDPTEGGKHLDYGDPSCQICHTGTGRPENLTRIVSLGGQDVILNVNIVRSLTGNRGELEPEGELLGLLLIETPLTELNRELLIAFWRIVAVGIFTFLLLTGLLLFTNRRFIVKPVREISHGVTAISAGNLEQAIPVNRQDELGRLANAFNEMTRRLKETMSIMDQRNRELAMFNDLALSASQMLDLQAIMGLALDTVIDRLGLQAGVIRLLDEESGRFTLRAYRGVSAELCNRIETLRLGSGPDLSDQVIKTGQVHFTPDMSRVSLLAELWDQPENRSHIIIPLSSRGTGIGTMALVTYPGKPYNPDNLYLLQLVGHEIGIAIHNVMLITVAQNHEQEARALHRLVSQASASLDLDQVQHSIAQGVRQIMSSDICLVAVIDEDKQVLSLAAVDGARTNGIQEASLPYSLDLIECLSSQTGNIQPSSLDCYPGLEPLIDFLQAEAVESLLIAPLKMGEKWLGFLIVAARQPQRFIKKECQQFERVAQQVIVAIDNARLYKQAAYIATLEERERLAREMHDRLAQALGYMNLKIFMTEELLDKGRLDQVRFNLQEMKQVSQLTYTDIREAIFNLRSVLASGHRFLPTLEEYIRDYRLHYGLNVELQTNNVDLSMFPPNVDVQLLRIIQEALTNVRKHAQATKVSIQFQADDHRARIIIQDNGRGFSPQDLPDQITKSFGLQIMRERAQSVGGSLRLASSPAQGTSILIEMPFSQEG